LIHLSKNHCSSYNKNTKTEYRASQKKSKDLMAVFIEEMGLPSQ